MAQNDDTIAKGSAIRKLLEQISQRDKRLSWLKIENEYLVQQSTEKQQALEALSEQVAEREQQVHALTEQVTEHEQQVHALTEQIAEREQQVHALTEQVAEYEQQVHALTEQVAAREQQVHVLTEQVTEHEQQVHTLKEHLAEVENKQNVMSSQLEDNTRIVQQLQSDKSYLWNELQLIKGSYSWKAIQKMIRLRQRIAPVGTRRERAFRLLLRGLEVWWSEGFREFLRISLARILHRKEIRKPQIPVSTLLQGKMEQIETLGLFDSDWYLEKNRDVLESGINPIAHYLRFGATEGRNPNPLFNTSLYVNAHGGCVSPENALIHFFESKLSFAPGAYRSPDVLLDIQRCYQGKTNMQCIDDLRATQQRYAVYLQCGSGSIHSQWLKKVPRPWDLIVNHYDRSYLGKIPCEIEFLQTGFLPGTKITSFFTVLTKWPSLIHDYDYILLLDDDIFIEETAISDLFTIANEYSLDLAQASLSLDSHCAHPVFKNHGSKGLRYVNAVEIMMPVISQRALSIGGHLFSQTVSGWGLDMVLGKLVSDRFNGKIAVIDDVVAKHSKAIDIKNGAFYRMLHSEMIYPEIELTHIEKLYSVGQAIYEVN